MNAKRIILLVIVALVAIPAVVVAILTLLVRHARKTLRAREANGSPPGVTERQE